jgi:hypothetical protein
VFIEAADLNGDGDDDIITGAWWYENPGIPGGNWTRREIGAPFNEHAVVYDFDKDGDRDILGTVWDGANPDQKHRGDRFVWARNNGSGSFTVLNNVPQGNGDFLQGVAVAEFQPGTTEVILSWHARSSSLQRLTVPANPSAGTWVMDQLSPASQFEDLSLGDIDRDGDMDLLQGTKWMRNGGGSWTAFTLYNTGDIPDRNELADVNGDGRLDAVIGYEAVSSSGKLAWYEQPAQPTNLWSERVIANIIGPMSVDAADMDGDGDIDVVAGEHNTQNPNSASLYVFENAGGQGMGWTQHLVYTGDEHHDGAQVVDIDHDSDLDIISIGWNHGKVVVYEQISCDDSPPGTPTPTNTPTVPMATPTFTPTAGPTATPSTAGATVYVSAVSNGNVRGLSFKNEDILAHDTAADSWSLYFDGSRVGLSSANLDAFDLMDDGSILLSLTAAEDVPGLGIIDDSDIIRFIPTSLGANTAGSFEWFFDGSDVGLTTNREDIDAITFAPDGRLVISTVGSNTAGSISGKSEDLLAFSVTQPGENTDGVWWLYFDGSDVGLTETTENVGGAWINPASGQIYLSVQGDFLVSGVSGGQGDVFVCTPLSLGNSSGCSFGPGVFWHGPDYSFNGQISGIGIAP